MASSTVQRLFGLKVSILEIKSKANGFGLVGFFENSFSEILNIFTHAIIYQKELALAWANSKHIEVPFHWKPNLNHQNWVFPITEI